MIHSRIRTIKYLTKDQGNIYQIRKERIKNNNTKPTKNITIVNSRKRGNKYINEI